MKAFLKPMPCSILDSLKCNLLKLESNLFEKTQQLVWPLISIFRILWFHYYYIKSIFSVLAFYCFSCKNRLSLNDAAILHGFRNSKNQINNNKIFTIEIFPSFERFESIILRLYTCKGPPWIHLVSIYILEW